MCRMDEYSAIYMHFLMKVVFRGAKDEKLELFTI